VQNLTWQWIFWINVPIAAVLILGSAQTFSDGFGSAIAIAAALAFAGAVIGLLLPPRAARTTGHTVAVPAAQQVSAR
jgi:type IV secretory pathway TrbL component